MMPNMSAITLMFWIKINSSQRMALFSYAIEDSPEEFFVGVERNCLVVIMQSHHILKLNISAINDSIWHHLAIIIGRTRKKIFLDGSTIYNQTMVNHSLPLLRGGGVVAIGQKLECENGVFNPNMSFVGEISYLNLWNHDVVCENSSPMVLINDKCTTGLNKSTLVVKWNHVYQFTSENVVKVPSLQKTCSNKGEIFPECGSACAKTCRGISHGLKCSERCIPGCQCPKGSYLDEKNRCVPMKECPCFFEGNYYKAGESANVGRCKTCTCNMGAMDCVEDRNCSSKSPCKSFPCKNDGRCLKEGDTFSCICINGYHGKTCEELPPTPCDSRPCKNNGICSINGDTFSCECASGFEGNTCEFTNACAKGPCKNEGVCTIVGSSYKCECKFGFTGKNCELNVKPVCVNANWRRSFDKQGWSTCDTTNQFITGLYRNKLRVNNDGLYRLEDAKCCKSSPIYIGQKSICQNADWWDSFNKKGWSVCSNGYFLNGFYRSNGHHLHNLEEGKCCKPVNHPHKYGDCYHENIKMNSTKRMDNV
ncbi:neurogenic locus notch homolog protein 2-like [Xenia sp. Carnegie-2017]|uniref:neurogenic locus notch homolog protein 2-like n=1 Tax=Xenia sp. Carnegie-2017 TaxID=2897299 RepID=UPI001F04C039|nr:neurogenic locus notch homolog protein 2-like [Xenia sp. Carnegie-2017]